MLIAWKDIQNDERRLRSRYAGWLLFGLFLELLIASSAFFLIGFRILTIDQWIANIFFVGVFGQVASMVSAVLRYLFPDKSNLLSELIERL